MAVLRTCSGSKVQSLAHRTRQSPVTPGSSWCVSVQACTHLLESEECGSLGRSSSQEVGLTESWGFIILLEPSQLSGAPILPKEETDTERLTCPRRPSELAAEYTVMSGRPSLFFTGPPASTSQHAEMAGCVPTTQLMCEVRARASQAQPTDCAVYSTPGL